MRILLDECIDQRLRRDIRGHDVDHVRHVGWGSLSDGELLRRASGQFDAFVTVDRGIAFQQNVATLRMAVIVVRTRRNTRTALKLLLPEIIRAIERADFGAVTWVGER